MVNLRGSNINGLGLVRYHWLLLSSKENCFEIRLEGQRGIRGSSESHHIKYGGGSMSHKYVLGSEGHYTCALFVSSLDKAEVYKCCVLLYD